MNRPSIQQACKRWIKRVSSYLSTHDVNGIFAGIALILPAIILNVLVFWVILHQPKDDDIIPILTILVLFGAIFGGIGKAISTFAHLRDKWIDGIGKIIGTIGWSIQIVAVAIFAAWRGELDPDRCAAWFVITSVVMAILGSAFIKYALKHCKTGNDENHST